MRNGVRISHITARYLEGGEIMQSNGFIITGILRNGRRFKPIYTHTPWHYNIWRGTVWIDMGNGKRKKAYEIYN